MYEHNQNTQKADRLHQRASEGGYDYFEVKAVLIMLFVVLVVVYAVGCARVYGETAAIYEAALPASYVEAHGPEIRTAARAHAAHWLFSRDEEVDPWADFPDAASTSEQEDL